MKKSLIIFVVVCFLATGALVAQNYLTKPQSPLTLTTDDINAFLAELPDANLEGLRYDPKGKELFRQQIARSLAIAAEAEQRGLFQKPEIRSQLDIAYAQIVGELWKRRPEAQEKPITKDDIAAFYREKPTAFEDFLAQNPQFRQAPQMDELKEKYGEFQVARMRGEAAGINKTKTFQLQLRLVQANIVGNEIIAKLQEAANPTDEEIEAYYKAHPEEFEEYKASHILISTVQPPAGPDGKPASTKPLTEEEALAKAEKLIKELQSGADFAKLAEQQSDDPGSKKQGGDLGYFREGMMVQPFFEGVKALQVGAFSTTPVKTQFGYHIIKLVDKRTKTIDEPLKREITEKLRQRKVEAKLDELVARYGIVVPADFTIPQAPTS
ncbi:peptidylprolyl isomerase [Chloracidobacterium thermophilum]|uniref:peptidylprolyl isomerase n=1 Tax=Chloracidobacterium thermophilum TaxID=458033 RepID=UPI000738A447|nr:peptidylprolyl isomerase [Chloracidobacterium thermophilum]